MRREQIYIRLREYKKILEEKGFNVIYIGLYGSQNYNVDDEQSDIDCKAIILPSLHDIIFRKVTSTTIELETGAIDVKDIITFNNVIRKGNLSYIEAIDTTYSIGDKYIKELFRQIRPSLKSMLGAMYEKRKALTHEYPSKEFEFQKWGFDPKQYHHIIRLFDILSYINVTGKQISYLEYQGSARKFMIDEKRNKNNYTKEQVEQSSDHIIGIAKSFIPKDYKYEPTDLSKDVSEYIENKLKIKMMNDSKFTFAREYRTFDNGVPKRDLEKFPILWDLKDKDISYIVYENIEIL
nr:MAG TPA: RNA repair pathway protein [Caudoviricetes sp.]